MEKKTFKEREIINVMVDQIKETTGMKCKVVPQSNEWYDGYCVDTSALALQIYLGRLNEYLGDIKNVLDNNHNYRSLKTITLINNGINRNLSRMGYSIPVEDETIINEENW